MVYKNIISVFIALTAINILFAVYIHYLPAFLQNDNKQANERFFITFFFGALVLA